MKKRGQVTVLIILAIVIILVVGIVFFINNKSSSSNIENAFSNLGITSEATVVEGNIIGCLEQLSNEANLVIGLQGGYYNPPVRNSDIGFIFIPYYYYEGEFHQPSQSKIEKELAAYVDDNLDLCIGSLDFEDFDINYKNSKSKTAIKENQIEFNTDLTISIQKGELTETFDLSDHPITIESPLSRALEVATYITQAHREDPDFICISCVSEMAEERELFLDFIDFDADNIEYTTLVVISEELTDSEPYVFEFLNKYPATIPEAKEPPQ